MALRETPPAHPTVHSTSTNEMKSRSYWVFASLLLAITLLRTGIWTMPNLVMSFELVRFPYGDSLAAYPTTHYLAWSYLGPYLTHLLGITSFTGFFILHLGFALAAFALVAALLRQRLGNQNASIALLLYAGLPVSGNGFFWVGMDGLIHLLMVIMFVRPDKIIWGLLGGMLLGTEHFEIGFFAFSALALARFLVPRSREIIPFTDRWLLASVIGLVVGRFGLVLWFQIHSIQLEGNRLQWAQDNLWTLFHDVLRHPHLKLWGILGGGWFIFCLWWSYETPILRRCFGWPLLALSGLTIVVADTSRVLGHVTFPLLWFGILTRENPPAILRERAPEPLAGARSSCLLSL